MHVAGEGDPIKLAGELHDALSMSRTPMGGAAAPAEVAILETRFFKYHENMSEFSEVVGRMRDLGFVVYDMLDGAYRPQDGVLDLIDLVFAKRDGFLRSQISREYIGKPKSRQKPY